MVPFTKQQAERCVVLLTQMLGTIGKHDRHRHQGPASEIADFLEQAAEVAPHDPAVVPPPAPELVAGAKTE